MADYLTTRPGKPTLYLQLQLPPDVARIVGLPTQRRISMRTADRKIAKARGADLVARHQKIMALPFDELRKNRADSDVVRKFADAMGKGERWELGDGLVIETASNFSESMALVRHNGSTQIIERNPSRIEDGVQLNNEDLDIIAHYINGKRLSRHRKSVMSVYKDFRRLFPAAILRTAEASQGKKLFLSYYKNPPGTGTLAHGTAKKNVNWLSQAIRYAADEFKLTRNGFNGAALPISKKDRAEARANKPCAMSNEFVRKILAKEKDMRPEIRLLFRCMWATGMRNSEVTSIVSENDLVGGYRSVTIGEKTDESYRCVPLPPEIFELEGFPAKIEGPLFPRAYGAPEGSTDEEKAEYKRRYDVHLSNKLNLFLRACGIPERRASDGRRITAYSLRHRAKDVMRSASVPERWELAILGHSKKAVADGYGDLISPKITAPHMLWMTDLSESADKMVTAWRTENPALADGASEDDED